MCNHCISWLRLTAKFIPNAPKLFDLLLTWFVIVVHLDWYSLQLSNEKVLLSYESDTGHTLAGNLIKVEDHLTSLHLVTLDVSTYQQLVMPKRRETNNTRKI